MENQNNIHMIIDEIDCKLCKDHNINFPDENNYLPSTLEFFYKNKSNKTDGLTPICKKCTGIRTKKWNTDNPEWKKELDNNKIRNLPLNRYYSNLQRLLGKQKEWRKSERGKEKSKIYNQNRQNKKHLISKNEWINCKDYFNNKCAYCGLDLSSHYRIFKDKIQYIDFHKEHVIHDGNNTLDNCIPSCIHCNVSKYKFKLNDWYNESNPNYTEKRLIKILQWMSEDYKLYLEE
jgi:hypothetical protein